MSNDLKNNSPIISIRNLRKVYRMGEEKVVSLNNINLDISEKEFCCILGTSGSGKSTLLNMMAGLEKPTKGEIVIKNNHIEKMSEREVTQFRRDNIGFVFQSYNLMNNLTALENVTMPLVFKGVPKKERDKRGKKILEAVGLLDRMNHKPSQMSGGQQQRVSIARAYISNPKIVFADEPTGNLDTKTTLEIMSLITNLAKEHKQTLILVTHDPEMANYSDRVIYIKDGDIDNIKFINKRGNNDETNIKLNDSCNADSV